MCESYSRSLLRVSVAQICQALGWDSVQLSACHLLTDVLQRYLQQLGRGCHRYSELCEYRAGCGRAASGRSRVTPPLFPSLPRRLRGVRRPPPPSPRSGVSSAADAPRIPLRPLETPGVLAVPLPRPPTSRLRPGPPSPRSAPQPPPLFSGRKRAPVPARRLLVRCAWSHLRNALQPLLLRSFPSLARKLLQLVVTGAPSAGRSHRRALFGSLTALPRRPRCPPRGVCAFRRSISALSPQLSLTPPLLIDFPLHVCMSVVTKVW